MPSELRAAPSGGAPRRPRSAALLALVPLLLFAPILISGQVFLPYLPVGLPPLAEEHPDAAAEAMREGNWTLGDRIFPFLTDQIAARTEVRSGHLPTWEPLQGLGMPLLGGTIAGLAYPPNWLAFLIPPERAAAPLAALSLALAGLGLWLFLRRLGLDPRACLFGALAYQLGGWGLANLFYYMKVDAALWFPWALWAVEGLAAGKRWSAAALVGSLACSFLAGMVTIAIFVLAGTALYVLVRLGPWARSAGAGEPRGGRALLAAGVLLALGLAGAALQILPLFEASRASLRHELSIQEAIATSLPPATSLGILVPDLFGAPTDPTPQGDLPVAWMLTPSAQSGRAEHANALEWNTYALACCALLALVALVATPRRASIPGVLLLLSLGFAQAWPLVRWLYALPGLGLGAPGRSLALAWALWPWLAALGIDALLQRRPRAHGALLVASFAASVVLFLAWSRTEPVSWARSLEQTIVARYHETVEHIHERIPETTALAAGRHLKESLGRALGTTAAVLAGGVLALVLDRRRARFVRGPPPGALAAGGALVLSLALVPLAISDAPAGSRGPQALLGLALALVLWAWALRSPREDLALWVPLASVLAVEGFLGARGHVQGRSVLGGELFPPSRAIDAVREAAGDGRVLRFDPSEGLEQVVRLARPNMLVPYGIAELTPYPTFTPRELTQLFTAVDPRAFYRNHVSRLSAPELVDHPLLDLLRVQALLAIAPLAHPRLVALMERPGFCVYRRTGALPSARIVPRAVPATSDEEVVRALAARDADYGSRTWIAPEFAAQVSATSVDESWRPGTIASVERPARNRVLVRVEGSRGGWLVLHEQWARGWRARLGSSREVPVLRADHAYRAVPIPEGDFALEFRYAPRSFAWGALASALALGGVLLWELLHPRPARAG